MGDAVWSGAFAVIAFIVIFMAGIASVVVAIVYAFRRFRKETERRAALAARVKARGLSYLQSYDERAQLFTSAPFGLGSNRRVRDVVWGVIDDRPFETFAYSYDTQQTDADGNTTTQTHPFQVTWVPLPAPLPTMRFTADGAFQRFFAKMGAKDLNVESHEFNQRWKVWCADERTGHAVLTPALINFMLAPGWVGRSVVIESRLLMTYTAGRGELADLDGVVGGLYGFLHHIPGFLKEPQRD